jgi:TPR repeat protein
VTNDYLEAARNYRLAAEQGFPKAQSNLGALYADGEGVTRDYVEAVKWRRLAAAQGDALAQYNLGSAYLGAKGVTQNPVAALMWFDMAAENGYAPGAKMRALVSGFLDAQRIAEAKELGRKCKSSGFMQCE